MAYRIGIDVGGTNTDCVILDSDGRLMAKVKEAVTPDVARSIRDATRGALQASGLRPEDIAFAMLGTTQVTNAIIERKNLNRVGLIRIGAPATLAVPPLTGWPADLKAAVGHGAIVVQGGSEFDGREIAPLDGDAVRRFLDRVRPSVSALAVASVFSPVNAQHELWVRDLVEKEYGGIPVTLSHEIGSVGLLERENASVLNAAVVHVARGAVDAFREALAGLGIRAQFYLTQNDGTLMGIDYAQRYPIFTIACGPTNSMRGAAYLSGLADAVVIDVGGTSTDIGVIRSGQPRESSLAVEVGGVRTNFHMPDLISLGLGGGSVVACTASGVAVGPESLGYRIVTESQIFGGSRTTFTDVAVALGRAAIGTRAPAIAPGVADEAYAVACRRIEDAIERIKTNSEPLPAVAVGGGSPLLPDDLRGVARIVRPAEFDVANAIGAATARVSGRVDRIFAMAGRKRADVLAEATLIAEADAIRAGADPRALEVTEIEEVPLAYLPGNASRVTVRVAGDLLVERRHGEAREMNA